MKLEQYRSELDRLHFSDTEKSRMVGHLMEHQMAAAPAARRRPLRRIPALAVAAALCLTVTAGAVVTRLASEAFAPVYGHSHSALIDELGTPIGAADSSKGYTLTADAVIGDGYNALIAFSLSRDDGEVFAPETKSLLWDGDVTTSLMGAASGSSWFADADPTDNRIEFYYSIHQDSGVQGSAVTATLSNLRHIDWETGEETPLVDGSWKLRFEADYTDCTRTLEAGQTVDDDCGKLELTAVELSPIGFHIEGQYRAEDGTALFAQVAAAMGHELDLPVVSANTDLTELDDGVYETVDFDGELAEKPVPDEIILTLKDGTALDLTDGAGFMTGWEDNVMQIAVTDAFDDLIPLDDMASLTINGYTWNLAE